ncbi:hypothetical protein ACPA0F_07965 [Solibacillus silvestris]
MRRYHSVEQQSEKQDEVKATNKKEADKKESLATKSTKAKN